MNCSSQPTDYEKIIKKLELKNKLKLDTGNFMMETEKNYSIQMDSLLSILIKDLNESQRFKKGQLQVDHNIWKVKQKLKLNKIWDSLSKIEDAKRYFGKDNRVFFYQEKVNMTKARIIELSHKLKK